MLYDILCPTCRVTQYSTFPWRPACGISTIPYVELSSLLPLRKAGLLLTEDLELTSYLLSTWESPLPSFVVLSLDVNFGWNNLEFCIRNECVIDGYLLDYYPAMPAAYICYVESQAEHVYQQPFRGGTNELSAELDLPDVSLRLLTVVFFRVRIGAVPHQSRFLIVMHFPCEFRVGVMSTYLLCSLVTASPRH